MEELEKLTLSDFEIKSSHWVIVTHIIDPLNFYVQPVRYSKFIECIEKTYPKDKPYSLNTSDLILFNLHWMNKIPKFARGQVCYIGNANDVITCDIMGLDYGIFVKDVPLCHIWRLYETYKTMPPLAIKCQLLLCYPKDGIKEFDQCAVEAFKHFVGKEKVKIIIESKTSEKLIVRMYNSSSDDVSEWLAWTDYTKLYNITMQNTPSNNTTSYNALIQNAQLYNAQIHNSPIQNAQIHNALVHNAQVYNTASHNALMQNAQIYNAQIHSPPIKNAQIPNALIHKAPCVIYHAPIPNDMNIRLGYAFRQYRVGQTIFVKVLSGDINSTFYVGEVNDFSLYKHELENFAQFAKRARHVKRLPCDLIPGTPVFVKENEGVYNRGIVKEATAPFMLVHLHLVDIGIDYHSNVYHMRHMVRECIEMPPISIFCRANEMQMKHHSRYSKAIQPGNKFMITFEKVGSEYNIPHTVFISPTARNAEHVRQRRNRR